MNSLERWLAVLNREKPDRPPMDFWGVPEIEARLQKELQCESMDEVFEKLEIDAPVRVEPHYIGPPLEKNEDIYGCRFQTVPFGTGTYEEILYAPLAQYDSVEAIDAHFTWPQADWFDYSNLEKQIRGKEHRPVRAGGSEPFMFYKNMRGEEQAYLDLMINPDIVEYCLQKLYDFAYEWTSRIYEALPGKVHITFVAEDLGSQTSMMYTPDQVRQFFIPHMKRMIELVHQAGAYAFNHSDGAIRPIIPDLIEAGFDALNPIQYRCTGMDREGLKRDFGDQLIFHGAVENQEILPFGTTEDVRREVRENLDILGAGGGYILAPCHNIQANTPIENVIALYDEGIRYTQ